MKAVLALGALLAAGAANAQPSAEPKIAQVIVYGDDPCPVSTDDTIVVCAKKPERERYRIPEDLRDNPNDPANLSWTTRATELQYVGRGGIGSCSPVGPGGMIGCFNDLVRQARAERASGDVQWKRLVEEARRERMERIEQEAAEEEAAQQEANSPQ